MTEEQRKKVEELFIERCKTQSIKLGSKKFYTEQASFFAGVMLALHVTSGEVPNAYWALCCMSNRNIVEYELPKFVLR